MVSQPEGIAIYMVPHYIDRIAEILCEKDPFVIIGYSDEKRYSVSDWIHSKDIQGLKIVVHLDRNIMSYLSQFLRKDSKNVEEQKLALAIVIFLGYFGSEFDIVQSIVEGMNGPGDFGTITEDIKDWVKIESVLKSEEDLNRAVQFLFSGENGMPPYSRDWQFLLDPKNDKVPPGIEWKSAYIHLLKMFILKKSGQRNLNGLSEYLDWVVKEYKGDFSCVIYALLFFSSNSPSSIPIARKKLHNIAWDLVHITTWFRDSYKFPDQVHVLVSNDKKIKRIAGAMVSQAESAEKLLSFLENLLSKQDFKKVSDLLEVFIERMKDSARKKRSLDDANEKDLMIAELESDLF